MLTQNTLHFSGWKLRVGYWMLIPVLLSGCVSLSKEQPAKKYYTLDAQPLLTTTDRESEIAPFYIRVLPFRAEPEVAGTTLSARLPDHRRRFYHNHEFVAPPASLIAAQFRHALNAELCADTIDTTTAAPQRDAKKDLQTLGEPFAVLDAGATSANATHLLDAIIDEIGGDLSSPEKPAAILNISLRLIDAKTRNIAFQKTYNLSTSIPDATPEAIISGLNTLLQNLRDDFNQTFANFHN